MDYVPRSINNLKESYKKLPGIGEKTALRLAFFTLSFNDEDIKIFSESLIDVKTKVRRCKRCNNLTEDELCDICKDKSRDNNVICVIEEAKNISSFEEISYNGLYHILGGLISPQNGINPEDINIENLLKRVKEEKIKEVILAIEPTIEGEITTLYIQKMLNGMNITVSKIAHGVPMGTNLEYLDKMTLEMALTDRKKISE